MSKDPFNPVNKFPLSISMADKTLRFPSIGSTDDIYKAGIEKGRQVERERIIGIINDLNSIGYRYGADYKVAILQALKGEAQ